MSESPAERVPSESDPPSQGGRSAAELLERSGRRLRVVDHHALLSALEQALIRALNDQYGVADRDLVVAVLGRARKQFMSALQRGAREGRGFSQSEFMAALAQAREAFSDTRDRVQSEIGSLQRELEDRQRAVRAERADLDRELQQVIDPATSPVAKRIREMFRAREATSDPLLELREEVIGYVLGAIQEERRKAVELRLAEHDRELDRLQRRIQKLVGSLERTEDHLKRMAKMKSLDPGLASIYREVQGLAEEDVQAEVKKEMMLKIFEANLKLREDLGESDDET